MDANIKKIEAFVCAAELGTISYAARRLNCSQSNCSRLISSLESNLDTSLFERQGSKLILTSEGKMLLPAAKELLLAHKKLQSQASEVQTLKVGHIALATQASVFDELLSASVARFASLHPQIHIDIHECTYEAALSLLQAKTVDFATLPSPAPTPEYINHFLKKDEIKLIASKAWEPPSPGRIDIRDLFDQHIIADSETAPLLQSHLINAPIRFITPNVSSIISMVAKNYGIALLPQLALQNIPDTVVSYKLKDPAFRTMFLVHKAQQKLSLSSQVFIEQLKKDGLL